ncbi:adenylate cyclase [Bradyrhizobium frederickii]|uniref:Adenylate cyclase n=1 Tax=Bradyrhizobium frederickii TaxID=2560054 RepID=A0A4Y9PK66_9BRAD|nr:adenylate/guanylate cyclase domain-containing protein [Bradyrhizobium frederickii]TFV80570.1 adenylate cyclase [Bradyrhizobium frederickii]
MDVAAWLRGQGLGQYEQAFRENHVDAEVLADLTAEDLIGLGVSSVGHRRKLLAAIAALRAGCSVPATAPPTTPPAAGMTGPPSEAERRQLTVMFCDLVGSTALSARLDPEDMREVIGIYQACVADVVGQHEGFVAKYMGDGVLVYFGYPQAFENDAERGVRAGLALVDAVGRLQTSERLRVRVGIATGLVVVGDLIGSGAAQERGVVGETPNLAARLQGLAEPNTVLISASTRRLTAGLFDYDDLGALEAKGYTEPIRAWRVVGESAVESRFEALRSGEALLVGREAEIGLLLQHWAQAKAGEGQVVLVSGEPGIGKSRLSKALQERIDNEPHVRLRYFCSPNYQASALHPHIAQLERAAGFEREDSLETKLDKIEALLVPTATPKGDVALFAELLSVPTADRYPSLNFSPQRKREETLEALLRQLELLSRQQAILMVYEDVHWIDPTSRELLDAAVERVKRLPVLLLVTCRSEFVPSWAQEVTVVSLSRLNREEGAALVTGIAGNNPLPSDILAEIVDRTDGVPLFVEELTKAVLEAGVGEVDPRSLLGRTQSSTIAVPSTLHASLMARLDHVGTAAKEIAQFGAVIGREFSHRVLSAAARWNSTELNRALSGLLEAGLILRRGTSPDNIFAFKHALVQDTAYGTLLRAKRRELHARIATVLEAEFAEIVQTQPELLAHHCTEAGLVERAVKYRLGAGQLALMRSATAETITQVMRGLELVPSLSDPIQRNVQELGLQAVLGQALMAARGFSAPETGRAYARAHELCREIGEAPQLFPVMFGLFLFYYVTAELNAALEIATEMLEIAERQDDATHRLIGHHLVAIVLQHQGQLSSASEHWSRALRLYDPERHQELAFTYGIDFHASILTYLSWVWLALGFPSRAATFHREMMARVKQLPHVFAVASNLGMGCAYLLLRRDVEELRPQAEAAFNVCTEQRFPFWLAAAIVCRGWIMIQEGRLTDGIAMVRQGVHLYQSTGAEIELPLIRSALLEPLIATGQTTEALDIVNDTLAVLGRNGDCWLEAEMLRIKGAALLSIHDQQAEACLLRAITVARNQNAKLWELRAAVALGRLWRDQGRHGDAYDLLAPIHDWFTEGFETPDLQGAKDLLDDLSNAGPSSPGIR